MVVTDWFACNVAKLQDWREMYIPALFSETRPQYIEDFIDRHPLGTLVGVSDGFPHVDHIPFLRSGAVTTGGKLIAHVAKGNSTWRLIDSNPNWLLVFTGATAYVSPSFYPSKKVTHEVVPTYNYFSIHLRGRLSCSHDRAVKMACVEALTQALESARPLPWAVSDAPSTYIDRMLEGIVAISFEITEVVAKLKASQNRSPEDQAGVHDGLRDGHETAEAAEFIGQRLSSKK